MSPRDPTADRRQRTSAIVIQSGVVGTDEVRTSPFLSSHGASVIDAITGRTHALPADDAALLDACREPRPLSTFAPDERARVDRLIGELLLLDGAAWTSVGAATVGSLDLEV